MWSNEQIKSSFLSPGSRSLSSNSSLDVASAFGAWMMSTTEPQQHKTQLSFPRIFKCSFKIHDARTALQHTKTCCHVTISFPCPISLMHLHLKSIFIGFYDLNILDHLKGPLKAPNYPDIHAHDERTPLISKLHASSLAINNFPVKLTPTVEGTRLNSPKQHSQGSQWSDHHRGGRIVCQEISNLTHNHCRESQTCVWRVWVSQ